MVKVDLSGIAPFADSAALDFAAAAEAHRAVLDGNAAGSDKIGWVGLPRRTQSDELKQITAAAERIRDNAQVLVVIGTGGSYLGAKAGIELLAPQNGVSVIFAGNSLSADSMYVQLEQLQDKDFFINVVSKSGTTLEPAAAFRVFQELAVKKYGSAAKKHILVTTDGEKGALRRLAEERGYERFVIPEDVGGRYSVLSAVGMLPMAAAGVDVRQLLAAASQSMYDLELRAPDNPAWQYAAARQALYHEGKTIEVLAAYEPSFRFFGEWWKQLFGESEGKNGVGIFPAYLEYNADLHSMGQYIQDGPRSLMETVVSFDRSRQECTLPFVMGDPDGLNDLAGRSFTEFSHIAREAVREAHIAGGVPNIGLSVPLRDEAGLADLFCFFEMSCAVSAYMLGVNPFDQPGVEAYKKNLLRLLERQET